MPIPISGNSAARFDVRVYGSNNISPLMEKAAGEVVGSFPVQDDYQLQKLMVMDDLVYLPMDHGLEWQIFFGEIFLPRVKF